MSRNEPRLPSTTRGCPDCGATTELRTLDGQLLAIVAATECCRPAVTRQVLWREREIEDVRRQIRNLEAAADHLRAEMNAAQTPTAKGAAAMRLERADAHLRAAVEEIYAPRLKDLAAEITRLRAKLSQMRPTATYR